MLILGLSPCTCVRARPRRSIARPSLFSPPTTTMMTLRRQRHSLIAVAIYCTLLLTHHDDFHSANAFIPPVTSFKKQTMHRTSGTRQHMTLVPLPVDELNQILVTGVPTAAQYSTYWGRSSREKYGALLEASIVTLLGLFMSYFLSFVLGTFVASILGSLCAMWIILSPELRAYQRNWELRGGRSLVDPWSISVG